MVVMQPMTNFSTQLNLMRSAIEALPSVGVDPTGSGYALGLVNKAQRLIDPPGLIARGWHFLLDGSREGLLQEREERAENFVQTAEAWLNERGIVLTQHREEGFLVRHKGIRQPLTLGQELRECALSVPLYMAMMSSTMFPVVIADKIHETITKFRQWRSLTADDKRNTLRGAGVDTLLLATSPFFAGIGVVAGVLCLVGGPVVGGVVALSRYSRGRVDPPELD